MMNSPKGSLRLHAPSGSTGRGTTIVALQGLWWRAFFLFSSGGCISTHEFESVTQRRDELQVQLAQTEQQLRSAIQKAETLAESLEIAKRLEGGTLIDEYLEVQERLTRSERMAASVEELLRDLRNCRAELDVLKEEKRRLEESHTEEGPAVIESKINGQWEGWQGDTVLRLINGQVWEQVGAALSLRLRLNPDVLIYRSSGGWVARIEGEERAVLVRRLK